MSNETRRNFLKTVPVAVAGAMATKTFAQQAPPAGPITAETIECAEKIPGLDFHAEEETAMANGLNRNLSTYSRLRDINLTPDIDPAIMFKPSLPGEEPKGPATPGAKLAYTKPPMTLKRPADLEDVAFWPVTHLAALIERKLVTSTELTKMYLTRLKRYQPQLNFYVTLTEDLALQLAAKADAEIKAGKYKGPLHGIPWGGKDLLATKGIRTTWGGEPYMEQVFDYNASVVDRLTEAGAVLVAKLSLGALAQGDMWFGGQTKNPWNGGRVRRVRDRHGDARLDHLALVGQRRRRTASDVRPREPVRRDGAVEHDGQARPDVPLRGRRGARAERDLRSRQEGRHGRGRGAHVESGAAARRDQDRVRAE